MLNTIKNFFLSIFGTPNKSNRVMYKHIVKNDLLVATRFDGPKHVKYNISLPEDYGDALLSYVTAITVGKGVHIAVKERSRGVMTLSITINDDENKYAAIMISVIEAVFTSNVGPISPIVNRELSSNITACFDINNINVEENKQPINIEVSKPALEINILQYYFNGAGTSVNQQRFFVQDDQVLVVLNGLLNFNAAVGQTVYLTDKTATGYDVYVLS